MRSRNGNRTLLLSVLPLILAPLIRADEFRIAYRAVTENAVLFNEYLSVSRAMTPCGGTPGESVVIERNGDLKQTLTAGFDPFFDFIARQGLHVTHRDETRNHVSRSRTVLTLSPRCFTVDFNEEFVSITALN